MHSDWLFGTVRAKSRFTTVSAVVRGEEGVRERQDEEDKEFMAKDWLDEKDGEIEVVESWAVNEGAGWSVW